MLAHGDVKFANQAIPAFVAQDQTMDFLHHEYEGMESLSSDSSYSGMRGQTLSVSDSMRCIPYDLHHIDVTQSRTHPLTRRCIRV